METRRKREKAKDRCDAIEGVFIGPMEREYLDLFDLLNGGHARIPQISHALLLDLTDLT